MKPGKWESEIQNLTTELLTQTDYQSLQAEEKGKYCTGLEDR